MPLTHSTLTLHTHNPMRTTQVPDLSGGTEKSGEGNMADVDFYRMNEAELRQWVEANPGRVNAMDVQGRTPLIECESTWQ